MTVLVTGGAGFIGSHLVDALLARGHDVIVLDNLSSGCMENLERSTNKANFRFVNGDMKTWNDWIGVLNDVTLVYHFAAKPEVRVGEIEPKVHFDENLVTTFKLLEGMRQSKSSKNLVFASTSTIYGEASIQPTPENYGPLLPISTYGATKLGCEALICSYAYTFGLRALILRLGNAVGARSRHGVVVDLIKKLRSDFHSLEILGDGTQKKSYIHISDCIDATLHATEKFLESRKRVDVYNVSSSDQVSVRRIAEIVVEELGLKDVRLNFTGGVDGGRGWLGDVKLMHLSISKLQELGWRPKISSERAIRLGAKELHTNVSVH